MLRVALVVLAIVAAVAIATRSGWIKPDALASQRIAAQRVDSGFVNYRRIYFEASVLRSGERLAEGRDAYVKAFERDGKLALCGFVAVPSGFLAERTRTWLDTSRLEIAGQRLRSDFIAVQPPAVLTSDAEAGCMTSELAWTADYLTAPLRLTGVPLLDAP